jgi:hypothetical protein
MQAIRVDHETNGPVRVDCAKVDDAQGQVNDAGVAISTPQSRRLPARAAVR